MIYTITFSPSLDYTMEVDNLKIGEINRSKKERMVAGGKGINVSVMLKHLGEDSVALGFVGGFIGDYIQKFLDEKMIETDFVRIEGNSRINVKLSGDVETAINGVGGDISNEKINELLTKTLKLLENDYLVISGNVPSNLPPYIYELLLSYIRTPNVKVVIDCQNLLLKNSLKYKPFLIKPNKKELEEYFNQEINTLEEVKQKCKLLQQEGAKNVIVSMGSEGAFMLTQNGEEIFVKAPKITPKSSVGAGDALIAGFIFEYQNSQDFEKALKYGVAAGSATTRSEYLATKEEVEELLNLMQN
ncbi:MAG: 1-phosphofructokinase [Clostridia bacterium]|nr:1-phosphofructokinase [Clostridia bacterium]